MYSNPNALGGLVDGARRRGADWLICLGDFGAYVAEPEAICPLLRGHGIECLAGDYDEVPLARARPTAATPTTPTTPRPPTTGLRSSYYPGLGPLGGVLLGGQRRGQRDAGSLVGG